MAKRNGQKHGKSSGREKDPFDNLVRGLTSFDRAAGENDSKKPDNSSGSPLSDRIGGDALAKLNDLFKDDVISSKPAVSKPDASSVQRASSAGKRLVSSLNEERAAAARAASERALERYRQRMANPESGDASHPESDSRVDSELLRQRKLETRIEAVKSGSKRPVGEEQAVFDDELDHLVETQKSIVSDLLAAEERAEKADRDAEGVYAIGPDDYEWVRELRRNATAQHAEASKISELFNEPYFARIDLEQDTGQLDTYYVGSRYVQGVCADWRSDIGQIYYVPNQVEFVAEGKNLRLQLKRSLSISKGCLKGVSTSYDAVKGLEADGLTDSFLIEVLKDKRRERRATDIIRTIQQNQNEIVRQDSSRSFAVQGCAGSGKTMIMLHRLSYLAYNDKGIDWSRTKIITPNAGFRAFVNDLSERLELQEIEMLSVEEYYGKLIEGYSSRVAYDATVVSEKTLALPLMEKLYSRDFFDEIELGYHDYWRQLLATFSEDDATALFSRYEARVPDFENHSESTWIILDSSARAVERELERARIERDNLRDELAKKTMAFSLALSESREASSSLVKAKEELPQELEVELDDVRLLSEKVEASILEIKEQLAIMRSLREECDSRIKTLRESGPRAVDLGDPESLEELLQSVSSEKREEVERVRDETRKLAELKANLTRIPRYNFGKRNSLSREITCVEESLQEIVSGLNGARSIGVEAEIKEFEGELTWIGSQIDDLESRLTRSERQKEAFCERQSTILRCLKALSSEDDLLDRLSEEELDVALSYSPDLKAALERVAETKKKCTRISGEIGDLADRIEEYGDDTEGDEELIRSIRAAADALSFNRLHMSVITRRLQENYRKFGQVYTKNNYRHKLYLKLLCCSLYFNYAKGADRYLSIDEAQDLSVAEYDLLQRIVGDTCVFNLYGDVNQAIYEYKGIGDWTDVFCISDEDVYVLNENYRNTAQITDRCNEEFYADMSPIGVTGSPVIEMNADEAIRWIVQKKKEDAGARLAVIFRHGVAAIIANLESLLLGEDVSWYQANDKKISVLTVEMAKGLEFDGVVVLTAHMTENEKYVSYTRAMDDLVIVNDAYSGQYVQDEEAEAFE